jgi:hypothetical protein
MIACRADDAPLPYSAQDQVRQSRGLGSIEAQRMYLIPAPIQERAPAAVVPRDFFSLNRQQRTYPNESITRSIAGCLRFFTLTQCFDLPPGKDGRGACGLIPQGPSGRRRKRSGRRAPCIRMLTRIRRRACAPPATCCSTSAMPISAPEKHVDRPPATCVGSPTRQTIFSSADLASARNSLVFERRD